MRRYVSESLRTFFAASDVDTTFGTIFAKLDYDHGAGNWSVEFSHVVVAGGGPDELDRLLVTVIAVVDDQEG